VDTLGVVKDKLVGKLLVKQFLVMDQIKVVIDKLLLEGSIVALNITSGSSSVAGQLRFRQNL